MRRRVQRIRVTQDRWLVSYADFITLLFGLFVVLYAFERSDQKKQQEVSASVDHAFQSLGLFPGSGRRAAEAPAGSSEKALMPINIVMGEDVLAPARVKEDLEGLRREMQQALSKEVATHTVSIEMGRDGLVISLREAGFFASGSATPKAESIPTLRHLIATLGRSPYDLRIEGHTDNLPIHSAEFDSNWELSSARATRIARIFIDAKAMPADRLSAAGYAEFHPVDSNETPEGRAKNRRVDLVVVPRTRVNFNAPSSASSGGPWQRITDDTSEPAN
jgi:chemotaxis protein MotB